MAGYRQFHTKFWKDEWLIELEPLERYLFSYLFTNELSSISGIYKLPKRVIRNETGLDESMIDATLAKFQAAEKIFYKDGVMWVVNMKAYHKNASPKTMTRVNADVAQIADCDVKTAYLYYEKTGEYCTDTVSIHGRESLSKANLNQNQKLSESDAPPPNIYHSYEQEIGIITMTVAEELKAAELEYPADWMVDAFKEAALQNKRSWKYAEAILKRWKVEGRKDKAKSNGSSGTRPTEPVMITLSDGTQVEAKP